MRMSTLFPVFALIPLMACSGDGGGEETVTGDLGDIAVTYTVIDTSHSVGGTDCPQLIAEIVLDNGGEADDDVTASAGADPETSGYPVDLDDGSGAVTGGADLVTTVAAGSTTTIEAWFNCGQTSSFTLPVTLENSGGDTWSEDVSLDISGG